MQNAKCKVKSGLPRRHDEGSEKREVGKIANSQ
jgi:hypothetical protein